MAAGAGHRQAITAGAHRHSLLRRSPGKRDELAQHVEHPWKRPVDARESCTSMTRNDQLAVPEAEKSTRSCTHSSKSSKIEQRGLFLNANGFMHEQAHFLGLLSLIIACVMARVIWVSSSVGSLSNSKLSAG